MPHPTAPEMLINELSKHIPPNRLLFGAPMAQYTTFHIGGPADILLNAASATEVQLSYLLCRKYHYPTLTIGGGSNLLVRDGGIRGLVIRISDDFRGVDIQGDSLLAQAGTPLPFLSRFAAQHALAGLSFACGIPGTVGGAVYMNAGAYGGEIAQTFQQASVLTKNGEIHLMHAQDMEFSYRGSRAQKDEFIVLDAAFRLHPCKKEDILAEMRTISTKRNEKQPMDKHSAGSAFKRPPGAFAAQLIEECGLKGYAIGDAMVSTKHSGFIINNRNASAKDVLRLISHITEKVFTMRGILLEPELRILGEDE